MLYILLLFWSEPESRGCHRHRSAWSTTDNSTITGSEIGLQLSTLPGW